MPRFAFLLAPPFLLVTSFLPAQFQIASLPPIPMPQDRAADSYRIYSALMPLGETANKGWPHDLFLVQDVTVTIVPAGEPCALDPRHPDRFSMNPHNALHAPVQYASDLDEVLSDFDHHCYDRVTLDAASFHASAPVRLLNPDEQKEFQSTRMTRNSAATAKFAGASSLYAFSEVYFNVHHTVALVYATHWCGGLCGEGFWVALTLENGQWVSHSWGGMRWIS